MARLRHPQRALALSAALLWALTPLAAHSQDRPLGWKATAVPLINFSSDDGTGYGLRLNLFHYNGHTVPYARAYSLQAFATTGGKQVHRIRLDAPNIKPGQRLALEAVFEKEDFANYFAGLDSHALKAYSKEEKTYSQTNPRLQLTSISTLRAPWQSRLVLRLGHRDIHANAPATGLLDQVRPLGYKGGLSLQGTAGLRLDTRDDYNDSRRGLLEEALVAYNWGRGGAYSGVRLGWQHRHFRPLGPTLVLAHRLQADMSWGDIPFYDQLTLGGSDTVRGLSASRQRDQARLLGNIELRWKGLRLSHSQRLYAGLLLFADVGQTFPRRQGPAADQWERGLGSGIRLHWHSTIVRADYGLSADGSGLYITFSQVF